MSLSARRLGKFFNLDDQEMNLLLKEEGFLDGDPGNYTPTEKGKKFISKKSGWNGYGGFASRSWEWNEWDESIIDELNITVTAEKKKAIREKALALRRRRGE